MPLGLPGGYRRAASDVSVARESGQRAWLAAALGLSAVALIALRRRALTRALRTDQSAAEAREEVGTAHCTSVDCRRACGVAPAPFPTSESDSSVSSSAQCGAAMSMLPAAASTGRRLLLTAAPPRALRVLVVGDGDFSFSRALLRQRSLMPPGPSTPVRALAHPPGSSSKPADGTASVVAPLAIVATTLDTLDEVASRHGSGALEHVAALRAAGAVVLGGVDATDIGATLPTAVAAAAATGGGGPAASTAGGPASRHLKPLGTPDTVGATASASAAAEEAALDAAAHGGPFDIVCFNFPHWPGKGRIDKNRDLLRGYFLSARGVLAPPAPPPAAAAPPPPAAAAAAPAAAPAAPAAAAEDAQATAALAGAGSGARAAAATAVPAATEADMPLPAGAPTHAGLPQVRVTLAAGQGGTPVDSVQREYGDSWMVVEQATPAGLVLASVECFEAPAGYRCVGRRNTVAGFRVRGALTHVFRPHEACTTTSMGAVRALFPPVHDHDVSVWVVDQDRADELGGVASIVGTLARSIAGAEAVKAVAEVDSFVHPVHQRRSVTIRVSYQSHTRALGADVSREAQLRVRDAIGVGEGGGQGAICLRT